MHYLITVRIINNNYAVIDNIVEDFIDDNFGRLQDLILLFQIPVCTRKDFHEIYGQFEHTLK